MQLSRYHARAFTLIEVAVAVLIVGLTLVAVGFMLQGFRAGTLVREQDLALKIANNELEALRAEGYAALPVSGTFDDSLLASLPAGVGSVTTTVYNTKTKQVDVSVSWVGQDQASHTVTLTTLVTETGGL